MHSSCLIDLTPIVLVVFDFTRDYHVIPVSLVEMKLHKHKSFDQVSRFICVLTV